MKKFRELMSREQLTLLPRSVDEFVPANDLVRYVDSVVEEFDLSEIEKEYSTLGRPAYRPSVMVKILLYGKMRSLRSSRELARACQENLRFIFLASGEEPDFRTISDFRRRFHIQLSKLLKQTIEIGLREEIIKLEHVAIDGTKLGASASRKSFKSKEKLEKMLTELESELKNSFEKDIAAEQEDDDDDSDSDGGSLPKELQDKQALKEKVKAALRHYEEIKGEKPKKVSLTDPECRYMRSKGTNPSYMGIAAVDGDSFMVVGGYGTNAVSENGELCRSLESVEENTGKNPRIVTADKGFRAFDGLSALKERGIDGYVPITEESENRFTYSDFTWDEENKCYVCPNNKRLYFAGVEPKKDYSRYRCNECSNCPLTKHCLLPGRVGNRTLCVSNKLDMVLEMKRKTESDSGKKMAKKRGATVELLFGCIKGNKKLRQLLSRTKERANTSWLLELAAYNVQKLASYYLRNFQPA